MEGNVFDVFRLLSLVVVWAIPAVLILAVVAFILAAPVLSLAGAVLRLYDAVRVKLLRKTRAEAQLSIGKREVPETVTTETLVSHTTEKELVGTKS